ncbi:transposase [bacterium BFN5]|nr:transposase [bacterium BFN5]QJW48924.1 transposase [bacterium BFN5]
MNEQWFTSMKDAREKSEEWRDDYNSRRPHSSLGMKTPQEFSEQILNVVEPGVA